ncbi:MAG: hypothetical protein MSS69_04920 [Spirochaetales bacterium]|nr:hypothetical protein [Spirochaetales bacterium]
MIQGYFLSILYLIISSLMFLQNKYRLQLSFVLRFSSYLISNKKALNIFTLSGAVVFLIVLFFPITPGPMILGDLVPALMILYETLYFYIVYGMEDTKKEREYINFSKEGRKVALGWISLIIATVHFVFPSFVLL